MTLEEALEKLSSSNFLKALELNLAEEKIGAEGAQALAEVLKSVNCPSGLKLELRYNNIGDKGAQALAKALTSKNCPSGLKLELDYNNIGDNGAQSLAEAFNSGHCRFGTTIRLDNEKYNFVELSEKNNGAIHQAALGIAILIGGFSHRNKQPTSRLMTMLPEVIVNHISGFLPGKISANKITAYLKKSFTNLMKKNMEYSQKHRSNNSVNQHLYNEKHGLILWSYSEEYRKQYQKKHPIIIKQESPCHDEDELNPQKKPDTRQNTCIIL